MTRRSRLEPLVRPVECAAIAVDEIHFSGGLIQGDVAAIDRLTDDEISISSDCWRSGPRNVEIGSADVAVEGLCQIHFPLATSSAMPHICPGTRTSTSAPLEAVWPQGYLNSLLDATKSSAAVAK